MRPKLLLWTHLLQNFVPPCLGGEERCYSSDMLHVGFLLHCSLLPLIPWFWLCEGSVEGFSHRYTVVSFLRGTDKRDFPATLSLYAGESKCQFHTSLWGSWCFLHLWSNSSSWRTCHSSAGRHLLKVERNTILSFGMPQVMEEQAGHICVEGFKMGRHLENYTPCRSQKPKVFSD